MSIDHYENFPVASILLPARFRAAVRDLYAFARGADDLADTPTTPLVRRQAALEIWRMAIQDIGAHRPLTALLSPAERVLFDRLGATIRQHQLPLQPFLDLLSAFTQDLAVTRYENEAAVLDYCRRSANPVGRLMLHLFKADTPENLRLSDAICTGLQRVNFCQDVALDHALGRCYMPLDCLKRHGAQPDDLASLCAHPPATLPASWRDALQEQISLARGLLLTGAPLAWSLGGRFGLELRLVVHGGLRILEKLEKGGLNPFSNRPILGRADGLLLCWRAFCRPRPRPIPALSLHHGP